jgi:hypothetical protein
MSAVPMTPIRVGDKYRRAALGAKKSRRGASRQSTTCILLLIQPYHLLLIFIDSHSTWQEARRIYFQHSTSFANAHKKICSDVSPNSPSRFHYYFLIAVGLRFTPTDDAMY